MAVFVQLIMHAVFWGRVEGAGVEVGWRVRVEIGRRSEGWRVEGGGLDSCNRLLLQLRNHKEEAGPTPCPIANQVNSTSQITTGKHLHFPPDARSVGQKHWVCCLLKVFDLHVLCSEEEEEVSSISFFKSVTISSDCSVAIHLIISPIFLKSKEETNLFSDQ